MSITSTFSKPEHALPLLYDAQFSDGRTRYTHGTFPTPEEAEAFGQKMQVPGLLDYIGWSERRSVQDLSRVIAANSLRRGNQGQANGSRRVGVITRWSPNDNYGFITDAEGIVWFIPNRSTLPDDVHNVGVYGKVSFSGSPHPPPGKKHPTAYSIRPHIEEAETASSALAPRFFVAPPRNATA